MNARSVWLPIGVVAALALLATPGRPWAASDSPEALAKVTQLNREGIALYQKQRFDQAHKVLQQALELCETAGLDRHPIAARTHVHLGIVMIGGLGQREIGIKQFGAALEIQPDIALSSGLVTPDLQEAFNQAVPAAPPQPVAAAPAQDDAPPPVPVARLAARRTVHADQDDEDEDDEEEDEEGGAKGGTLRSRIQIGVLVGAGGGWARGTGDLNADTPVESGSVGAAKLDHVVGEVGYWTSPTSMISLQGRFQRVSGPNVVEANGRTYYPATGAAAVFAAATWSPGKGRLRPFVSLSVGGGRIRHVVTFSGLKDCGTDGTETCVDTVGGGPFLAGAGGGLTLDLGQRLALVLALSTQLGAPQFTFNVDVNGGVAFRL